MGASEYVLNYVIDNVSFNYLKLIQIYICPQDVQCDVMCKGFIPLEFIVYSFFGTI